MSETLKQRYIKKIVHPFRIATSSIRRLPDFIIIGAQRCGTTSLYTYLSEHPFVDPAFVKEVHFFDNNYHKGLRYYRSFFPIRRKKDTITGEASPYYFFNPYASERIFKTISNVKLILLLRNPVDRAFSHYHHEVKMGYERLPFREAIRQEGKRLKDELEKMLKNEKYHSFNHQHYSYLSKGLYINQIKQWIKYFKIQNILIIKSEDFFYNPRKIYDDVTSYLNLSKYKLKKIQVYNVGNYEKMNHYTRKYLNRYFEPYNQELYDYLGRDFEWNVML